MDLSPMRGVLTERYVWREHCKACGAFDVKGKYNPWIFCHSCGESYHQSCANDAPHLAHPIKTRLPPGYNEVWRWQCIDCRRCSICPTKGQSVLTCQNCHVSYCRGCDQEMDSDVGFYYQCFQCRKSTPRKCHHCSVPLKTRRFSLFCLCCSKYSSCPRCSVPFAPDDYSEEMIACDKCGSWTHQICAGLSDKEYQAMGRDRTKFYCCRCKVYETFDWDRESGLPPECAKCLDGEAESLLFPEEQLADFETRKLTTFKHQKCCSRTIIEPTRAPEVWYRYGSNSLFLPVRLFDRILTMRLVTWSVIKPRQRVHLDLFVSFDPSWTLSSLVIKVENFEITSRSILDAFGQYNSKLGHQILDIEKFSAFLELCVALHRPLYTQRLHEPLFDSQSKVKAEAKAEEIHLANFRSKLKTFVNIRPNPSPRIESLSVSDSQLKAKETSLANFQSKSKSFVDICPSKSLEIEAPFIKNSQLRVKLSFNPPPKMEPLTPPDSRSSSISELDASARLREYVKEWKKPVIARVNPSLLDQKILSKISAINSGTALPALYVSRSRIAGFGLFASRPIPSGARILEYCGEVIGQLMADRRERLYSLLRLSDCYLFRLGADQIIDATKKANMARFINHSCEPNCESRVVKGKIDILAIKSIEAGEELTYDYKFSSEGADDMVSCYCGSPTCRKYMN